MKILTWHVHGSYLYYLVMAGMMPGREHQFYLPVKPGKPEGYGGRAGDFPWPDNMVDIPAEEVRNEQFDVILYQSRRNWEVDQHEILSAAQRDLPRIYLEHDPPRHAPQDAPTNTKHLVDDPNVLLVHCTHFNNLMWDNNRTPARVIEHGVIVPDEMRWTGEMERGIVVVNGLKKRGRRLGYDIWQRASEELPLDLAGMESAEIGGMGPIPLTQLWEMETRYRFFFNPIRYTSLGLAVLEAMAVGLPIVGLATTEMVSAVRNGINGYVETNVSALIEHMQRLLVDHDEAAELSKGARHIARERFGIERFARDWDETFRFVAGSRRVGQVPNLPYALEV
jgi:glycosyltransferase involved in cell wall biosynthesis